jgi:hypothetical protein
MRPDDLRGQVSFLNIDGMEGHYWSDVDNVILKSGRKWEDYIHTTTSADIHVGRPLLIKDDQADETLRARWFHRIANSVFTVMRQCMVRHSKFEGYNGRPELLMLPPKDVQHKYLEFSSHQQRVYNALFKHAKDRYERLKRQDLAVARVIQVMQMLAPVRQICSGGDTRVADVVQRMQNELQHDDDDESTRKNKQGKSYILTCKLLFAYTV